MAALAGAGFRVLAPDQRGYGGSAKPGGVPAYQLNTLALDAIGLAQALGRQQFSVVGHDWGGIVAWHLAMHHAVHVERAAILNAPHPATLLRYTLRNPLQLFRSAYVGLFQLPLAPELVLRANNYQALRWALTSTSRPGTFKPEELNTYRQAWDQEGALTGMLNWYRALLLPTASPGAGTHHQRSRARHLGRPRPRTRTRPGRRGHQLVRQRRGVPPARRNALAAPRRKRTRQ
jgi:pimeloyl-ACP methyl ester carboxylesterase